MPNTLFNRFSAVLTEMRELQANMTVQTMQVFMTIAGHDQIAATEIKKLTGIPQPSVSRALGDLGEFAHRRGEEGLKLVKTERDPNDLRNTLCMLTPVGKLLAARIEQLMGVEAGKAKYSAG